MDWVNAAEEYCGHYGWGARGKSIGISRMATDADKSLLSRGRVFASTRPRGILSGFFAIVPMLGYAVYLPPLASKSGPQRYRLRVSDAILEKGAIFSAYLREGKTLVFEDVLVWKGEPVWNSKPFEHRWTLLKTFLAEDFINDTVLQGGMNVECTAHVSLAELVEPTDGSVVEFVPNYPNSKRVIWFPPKQDAAQPSGPNLRTLLARRDVSVGPDNYLLVEAEETLGYALVRTLDTSRRLRTHPTDEFNVKTQWNRQFEKWEILEITA